MLQFREDSYCYNLLKTIALCGEFPYHSLYLIDGNERLIKRNILNMKKEGYITIQGKGQMRSIRLTKKAFEPLKAINEEYLTHYLSITDNHHFRGGKDKNADRIVWRRHRMAEINCMFDYIGAKLWTNEKPKLVLHPTGEKQIQQDDIIFYTSREMKNADIEQRYKTEFTRIMGALISPGGVYGVYNTNKGLMKWNQQGEGKAQVLIEDIVSYNYSGEYESLDNAIMFGKDMETALKILNSNGGKRDVNDFELLNFDNTYSNIYYITLDDNGIYQLNLLIQKNWYDSIRYSIFPESFLDTSYLSIECDAFDKKNNKYIIMFLDGNIGRLKRFKEASYDNKSKKYEVVCFDWQEDMVKEYIGENASLLVITTDKLSELITETYG
jgi:hypothetical protein